MKKSGCQVKLQSCESTMDTAAGDAHSGPHHPNFRSIDGTIHFRSSALDDLSEEQIDELHDLGVKVIIDLRSASVWENDGAAVPNLIDYYYTPAVVKRTWMGNEEKCNLFTDAALDKLTSSRGTPRGSYGRRYFMSLLGTAFGLGVISEAPWSRQIQLAAYLIAYFLFGDNTVTRKIPEWCLQKPGETMLLTYYKGIINHSWRPLESVFRLLLEIGREPVVIICAQGKDRTGLVSALIQLMCGLDRERILQDYERTKAALPELMAGMIESREREGVDESFMTCERETLSRLLSYIESRYGGLSAYLCKIGVKEEDQKRLSENVQRTKIMDDGNKWVSS